MKSTHYFAAVRSILLVFVMLELASTAWAQSGTAEPDSFADYTFGEELRFTLSMQDAGNIERITLSFRPELSSEIYVVDVPFEPGETLSVTYPVDVGVINLQPYSPVIYSWELETDSGPQFIPEKSFNYEDDKFSWTQMTRNGATAHWTGGEPFLGGEILDVVESTLAQLRTVLPLQTIRPIDVYVFPSSADLRSSVEMAGLDVEDAVYPGLDVIFVTAVNPESAASDLGQGIPYKLAHLLIYQVASDNYETFPWWLSEGLATVFRSRPNARSDQILDETVKLEGAIPLWQLCEAPAETSDQVELASAQSLSIVKHIRERYGDAKIAELVSSYAQGDDCESGVENTLGMTLQQLDSSWLDAQQSQSVPVQVLGKFGLWISILLAGFGLALMVAHFSTRGRKTE